MRGYNFFRTALILCLLGIGYLHAQSENVFSQSEQDAQEKIFINSILEQLSDFDKKDFIRFWDWYCHGQPIGEEKEETTEPEICSPQSDPSSSSPLMMLGRFSRTSRTSAGLLDPRRRENSLFNNTTREQPTRSEPSSSLQSRESMREGISEKNQTPAQRAALFSNTQGTDNGQDRQQKFQYPKWSAALPGILAIIGATAIEKERSLLPKPTEPSQVARFLNRNRLISFCDEKNSDRTWQGWAQSFWPSENSVLALNTIALQVRCLYLQQGAINASNNAFKTTDKKAPQAWDEAFKQNKLYQDCNEKLTNFTQALLDNDPSLKGSNLDISLADLQKENAEIKNDLLVINIAKRRSNIFLALDQGIQATSNGDIKQALEKTVDAAAAHDELMEFAQAELASTSQDKKSDLEKILQKFQSTPQELQNEKSETSFFINAAHTALQALAAHEKTRAKHEASVEDWEDTVKLWKDAEASYNEAVEDIKQNSGEAAENLMALKNTWIKQHILQANFFKTVLELNIAFHNIEKAVQAEMKITRSNEAIKALQLCQLNWDEMFQFSQTQITNGAISESERKAAEQELQEMNDKVISAIKERLLLAEFIKEKFQSSLLIGKINNTEVSLDNVVEFCGQAIKATSALLAANAKEIEYLQAVLANTTQDQKASHYKELSELQSTNELLKKTFPLLQSIKEFVVVFKKTQQALEEYYPRLRDSGWHDLMTGAETEIAWTDLQRSSSKDPKAIQQAWREYADKIEVLKKNMTAFGKIPNKFNPEELTRTHQFANYMALFWQGEPLWDAAHQLESFIQQLQKEMPIQSDEEIGNLPLERQKKLFKNLFQNKNLANLEKKISTATKILNHMKQRAAAAEQVSKTDLVNNFPYNFEKISKQDDANYKKWKNHLKFLEGVRDHDKTKYDEAAKAEKLRSDTEELETNKGYLLGTDALLGTILAGSSRALHQQILKYLDEVPHPQGPRGRAIAVAKCVVGIIVPSVFIYPKIKRYFSSTSSQLTPLEDAIKLTQKHQIDFQKSLADQSNALIEQVNEAKKNPDLQKNIPFTFPDLSPRFPTHPQK